MQIRVRIRVDDREPPGKPQSRIEDRDSGAEGVLDGGIFPDVNGKIRMHKKGKIKMYNFS